MAITVVHQMGGMIESQETGIYPDYIFFYSEKHKKKWKRKFIDRSGEGVLSLNKKPVANFIYKEEEIKIQEIDENGIAGKWYLPKAETIFVD